MFIYKRTKQKFLPPGRHCNQEEMSRIRFPFFSINEKVKQGWQRRGEDFLPVMWLEPANSIAMRKKHYLINQSPSYNTVWLQQLQAESSTVHFMFKYTWMKALSWNSLLQNSDLPMNSLISPFSYLLWQIQDSCKFLAISPTRGRCLNFPSLSWGWLWGLSLPTSCGRQAILGLPRPHHTKPSPFLQKSASTGSDRDNLSLSPTV